MSWWKVLLIICVGLLLGATAGAVLWYKTGRLQQTVVENTVRIFSSNTSTASLVDDVLGFYGARTYLLLFLNNTELRPGGGFLGAYAVVEVDKAVPHIVKVEGTEILDNYAPQDFPSVPPEPLKKYLKVDRWSFRDSNWWPDFRSSTQKSLELYAKEKGVAAGNINSVIAFTPTAAEELLKITGPITVDGQEFTSENFTEKMEYEVEYGYANKGIDFNNRKKLLGDFGAVLVQKLRSTAFSNWRAYLSLVQRMVAEKHIVMYSMNSATEDNILREGWGGEMKKTSDDYVLWADANLGALKTDAAMRRSLSYTIAPATSTGFVGTVTMHYNHTGSFDWRTSRYRSYARVYVPVGSTFVAARGVMQDDKNTAPGRVDSGVENGYQWFGGFVSIEPGRSADVSFTFKLAPAITERIHTGTYQLLAQKQIGTVANQLTLGLDFGTKVVAAAPGEAPEKHGDTRYDYTTDLRLDREFTITLTD